MKYLALFLVLVIALSAIDAKVRRSTHRARRADKTNNFYQFLVGAVAAMGGDDNNVEQCLSKLPAGWESAGVTEAANPESLDKNVDKGSESTWTKILGYLGTAIDVVCMVKDTIKSFFEEKRRRWIRRNRRLFLQGKRMRRFSWSWSGMWNSVTSSLSNAWNGFKAGINKLKNKVVDGIDWTVAKVEVFTKYVQEKLTAVFKPIGDAIESLKQKLIGLLMRHPFFQQLGSGFLNCILSTKTISTIIAVVKAISNFLKLLPTLATPIGWVNLVVNLICGWETVKKGIEALKAAWNATVPATKYNMYGKMAGHFIVAIGGDD